MGKLIIQTTKTQNLHKTLLLLQHLGVYNESRGLRVGRLNKSCPVPVASLVQLFGPRSRKFKQLGVFCCTLISHSYLDSLRNKIPRDGFLLSLLLDLGF
jgi:hypothetical protein